jgi:catechol 2,3-dioxygenase-like lactoylglutathione lyase family enzyme
MTPQRIDHVALWVADREADTRRILDLFDVDILEQGDDFTLIGSSPELGKLTLFDAEGPRAQSQLMGVAFREPGREDARDVDVGEGLHLYRLGMPDAWAVDLDHVSLRVADAETSAQRWQELGFERVEPRVEPSARVRLGESFIELTPGTALPTEKPLLNHIGLLVESIDPYLDGTADVSVEILEVVDADNARAVFVQGPDDVRVELIEHKPSFAETAQPGSRAADL